MLFTLSIKPSDDVSLWFVFVDGRPVSDWNRDFQTSLRLEAGDHRLVYQIEGADGELEINLEPNAPITTPLGESWPYSAKVPAQRPRVTDAIYFRV